jgi:excinuclease ABC subunit B
MYAEETTGSMKRAIDETERRRSLQRDYNAKHGIQPQSIVKSVHDILGQTRAADARGTSEPAADEADVQPLADLEAMSRSPEELLARLEAEMRREARALRFENAASLRDRIREVRARL